MARQRERDHSKGTHSFDFSQLVTQQQQLMPIVWLLMGLTWVVSTIGIGSSFRIDGIDVANYQYSPGNLSECLKLAIGQD